MSEQYMKPELGKVSRYLDVPDLIVRAVPSYGVTSEFDGGAYDSSDSESEDYGPEYEDRLQGRLVNTRSTGCRTSNTICPITIAQGVFWVSTNLGSLTKTSSTLTISCR